MGFINWNSYSSKESHHPKQSFEKSNNRLRMRECEIHQLKCIYWNSKTRNQQRVHLLKLENKDKTTVFINWNSKNQEHYRIHLPKFEISRKTLTKVRNKSNNTTSDLIKESTIIPKKQQIIRKNQRESSIFTLQDSTLDWVLIVSTWELMKWRRLEKNREGRL